MLITFNLYSPAGLESKNTLSSADFAEFIKLAQSFKQTIRVISVKAGS
jgi:hypothetical protein